jgi:broad specificity phosphatase PhoE
LTDIFLVRHGETVWHAKNRYAGVSDVDLTARGHEQAGRLAEWAGAADLSGVWASNLRRARETARGCVEATGHRLRVDDRLRELDFGRAEGMTRTDMAREFPDALRAFQVDPVQHHLPGGEDPRSAARRFVSCLRDIATEDENGRILVVAHSTVIRLGLCDLIGVPLGRYRAVLPQLRNCALTQVLLRAEGASLLQLNVSVDLGRTPDTAPDGSPRRR